MTTNDESVFISKYKQSNSKGTISLKQISIKPYCKEFSLWDLIEHVVILTLQIIARRIVLSNYLKGGANIAST